MILAKNRFPASYGNEKFKHAEIRLIASNSIWKIGTLRIYIFISAGKIDNKSKKSLPTLLQQNSGENAKRENSIIQFPLEKTCTHAQKKKLKINARAHNVSQRSFFSFKCKLHFSKRLLFARSIRPAKKM